MIKTWNDLKVGNIIHFHGGRLTITEKEENIVDDRLYITVNVIPADVESEQLLGGYYSRGHYSAVSWASIEVEEV